MKKILRLIASVFVVASLSACVNSSLDESRSVVDPDYTGDFSTTHTIQKVIIYSPENEEGEDVYSEFSFFDSMSLTLYYEGGVMSSLEISEDSMPFTAFKKGVPEGKVECYFDKSCYPNAIKLKSDDSVIAYYKLGQFYLPFQLECSTISYEYWFK